MPFLFVLLLPLGWFAAMVLHLDRYGLSAIRR